MYIQVQQLASSIAQLKFVITRSNLKSHTDIEEKKEEWKSIHTQAEELLNIFGKINIRNVEEIEECHLKAQLFYMSMKRLDMRIVNDIDINNFTGLRVQEFIDFRRKLVRGGL
jgi:hypothetical protein